MHRRTFLKTVAVATTGVPNIIDVPRSEAQIQTNRVYQGSALRGWDVVVGDGLYVAPGEEAVSLADIATIHTDTFSELRANIRRRNIMAHNITVKSIIAQDAFQFTHTGSYAFRIPFDITTSNTELNAQTIEGGLFVWDGSRSRKDYGLAFHWLLNPWMDNFGEIACWDEANGGQWTHVGKILPDMQWHNVTFTIHFASQTTSMKIDDRIYPSCFTANLKPSTWGAETSARLQVEIISLYPGSSGVHPLHKAEVRDWLWTWQAANSCSVFLPSIAR